MSESPARKNGITGGLIPLSIGRGPHARIRHRFIRAVRARVGRQKFSALGLARYPGSAALGENPETRIIAQFEVKFGSVHLVKLTDFSGYLSAALICKVSCATPVG